MQTEHNPTGLLVQPVSVLDQAVLRLRTAIITGEFLPGEKLIEQSLCQRMGISRASLREALRRLEAVHLVDLIPNRGPFVAKLGPHEVDEIHQVWQLLQSEIVYQFVKLAKPVQIAQLEERLLEIQSLTEAGDAMGHVTATNAFFKVIVDGCGNRVLGDTIRNLMYRIHFLRARSLIHERLQRVCIEELGNIVAAVHKRNPKAARLAVQRHIDAACKGARETCSEQAVA
jgi:DNA-binding GntR family transcriptional regulator